jgi:outer membrane protein assembly factor BamB
VRKKTMNDLVYVGFNSRVAALHRDTGELVWNWRSPHGSGYTTILLDGDRLIVSVQGYTYCLDPLNGSQLWFNELEGMGVGVAALASRRGGSTSILPQAADRKAQEDAATAHGTV